MSWKYCNVQFGDMRQVHCDLKPGHSGRHRARWEHKGEWYETSWSYPDDTGKDLETCSRMVGIKEEIDLKSRYAGNLSVRTDNLMESDTQLGVVVTNIKMPFGSMVVFMIKWALASIPAAIILLVIYAMAYAIAVTIFGGFSWGF